MWGNAAQINGEIGVIADIYNQEGNSHPFILNVHLSDLIGVKTDINMYDSITIIVHPYGRGQLAQSVIAKTNICPTHTHPPPPQFINLSLNALAKYNMKTLTLFHKWFCADTAIRRLALQPKNK